MLHSQRLLDHFRNPRNVGDLPDPAIRVEAANPACGDTLRLSVHWSGEHIETVAFKSRGCTAAIACGSALTELMGGRTRAQLTVLTSQDVEDAVDGLPPESGHAAILCMDALKLLLRKLP